MQLLLLLLFLMFKTRLLLEPPQVRIYLTSTLHVYKSTFFGVGKKANQLSACLLTIFHETGLLD